MAAGDRLCALVLSHHSPELLGRMLQRLDQFGVTCFVHVDRKIAITPFKTRCEPLGAKFIRDRVEIKWGGYSIVEATLNLIEAALAGGDFTHFLLLSGDTYPVRARSEFRDYLTSRSSRIQIREVPRTEAIYQRISRVYIPDSRAGALISTGGDPSVHRYVTSDLVSEFPDIEEACALKRREFPWKFGKGSQWWSLTRAAVERCLEAIERHGDYVKWFRYSSVPDESFFQSLFLNFVTEPAITTPPVFTVWDRCPRPYIFSTAEDLVLLDRCKTVLARKFSEESIPALDQLDIALDSDRS